MCPGIRCIKFPYQLLTHLTLYCLIVDPTLLRSTADIAFNVVLRANMHGVMSSNRGLYLVGVCYLYWCILDDVNDCTQKQMLTSPSANTHSHTHILFLIQRLPLFEKYSSAWSAGP